MTVSVRREMGKLSPGQQEPLPAGLTTLHSLPILLKGWVAHEQTAPGFLR